VQIHLLSQTITETQATAVQRNSCLQVTAEICVKK